MESCYLLRVVIGLSCDEKINTGSVHILGKMGSAVARTVPTTRNKICLSPYLRNHSDNCARIFYRFLLFIYLLVTHFLF